MNDIRRTILWVIFAFSLVMLWDQWQVHNGHKATFFPSASPVAAKPGAGASAVPPAAAASTPAAVPAGGAVANASGQPPVSEGAAVAHERITVSTDVLKLTFDTEGGSVIESELLKYPDDTQADRHVLLFDSQSNEVYQAQTGLIGGAFPNHKTPMAFGGDKTLADGAQQLVVRFESPEVGGVKLVKTYTLKRGSYVIGVRTRSTTAAAGAPAAVPAAGARRQQAGQQVAVLFHLHRPGLYTDAKKYQKVSSRTSRRARPSS
jgi:YidC/Oxa1 family membrane protein insertase